ncbi:MAG: ATP-grasp domain-containing protein [Pseudomonas sp.]
MKHIVLGGSANALAICRQLASPDTILLDIQARAPAYATRHARSITPASSAPEDILQAVLDLACAPPQILYPTSDFWLEFIRREAPTLRQNGFLFFQKTCDCADILLDKLRFFEVMSPHFQVPYTHAARDASVSDSQIVKPRRAFIGSKVSEKGFNGHTIATGTHVTQQRLNSDLRNHLSISGLFVAGSLMASISTRKVLEYPHPGGTAVLVTTIDSEHLIGRLRSLAEQALRFLDYEGIFELEAILQDGELWLLEINGRFWLQHAMGSKLGINFSQAYRDTLLGKAPEFQPRPKGKVVWVHEGMPVAFIKASGKAKLDAIKTILGKGRRLVFAHFSPSDAKPLIEFVKCKLAK